MIEVRRYRDNEPDVEVLDVDALPANEPDALVWIDCDRPPDGELEHIAGALGLHEFVLEDLQHSEQRTKLDHYSNHWHVAVHDCELIDDELVTREVDVVFGEGWLLSVRQVPEDNATAGEFPIDAVLRRFEATRTEHGSTDEGFLLWALLDVVVDRYFVAADAVDDRIDEIEDVVLDDTVDRIRRGRPRELFELSKALVRFRRAALPLREVVGAFLRKEVPCIDDPALAHFQDLYDHVLRVGDFIESQRDVMTGLRDADLAVTSNQMSLVQQRIAAWGAILIVATLISGILGMNFRNAPELDWEQGFLVVLGVMLLTGLPIYVYFKRKKWL